MMCIVKVIVGTFCIILVSEIYVAVVCVRSLRLSCACLRVEHEQAKVDHCLWEGTKVAVVGRGGV
jgi:hypothetical protein